MIDSGLMEAIEKLIPSGKRSDFANKALEEQLIDVSRRNAIQKMAAFSKKHHLKISTAKIIKDTNNGLE